jgi:hypothetical protein
MDINERLIAIETKSELTNKFLSSEIVELKAVMISISKQIEELVAKNYNIETIIQTKIKTEIDRIENKLLAWMGIGLIAVPTLLVFLMQFIKSFL